MKSSLFAMTAAVVVGLAFGSEKYEPKWESLARHECPQWWKDAKFGIFVHWGPYAVPAYAPLDRDRYAEHFLRSLNAGKPGFREHLEKHFPGKSYFDLAAQFTARDFDPSAWAALFRRAGAKYVVLTSKHHDGFCLWPSAQQPYWNSVAMGPHRDLVGELSDAVRKAGLHMGLYYSVLEKHPLYKPETIGKFVEEINLPQLKDIVCRYKPEIVWPDGEWDYPAEVHRGAEFLAWLLNESPVKDNVVFNDRWGMKMRGTVGDFYTTEYGHNGSEIKAEFYCHPWEECRGIGGSFGYNAYEGPAQYMTPKQCVDVLVRTVALGGNLLLNVGPDHEGRIPVPMVERLEAIGDWLDVNGEAIYGTTYDPKRYAAQGKDGVYVTTGPDALYAICTKWPKNGLVVENAGDVAEVALLGSGEKVEWRRNSSGGVEIVPPPIAPDETPCSHAWTFRLGRNARAPLGNAASLFERGGRRVVAFLGGSITQNPGYRTNTKEYLARRFPKTEFEWIDAGLASTCSNTGAFRFKEDVLAKGVPDLLFVEFAVNDDQDGGFDVAECRRGMEGIIRQARTANRKMDVVVVLMVNKRELDLLGNGETPIPYAAHSEVAALYGAPVFNVGERLAAAVKEGSFSWERYKDCHPSPEANELIAKWMDSFLDANWGVAPSAPTCRPFPPALQGDCYDRGVFVPLTSVEMNDKWFSGWNLCMPYWPGVPGLKRPAYDGQPLLWSTKPGDAFAAFFNGNAFGMFVLAGPDAGIVNVEIDGRDMGDFDLYHDYSEQLNYPYVKMVAHGLAEGNHRVVVKLTGGRNPKSCDTAARIYKLVANGRAQIHYTQAVADPALPAE